MADKVTCPTCDGSGKYSNGSTCQTCGGSGEVVKASPSQKKQLGNKNKKK